MFEYGFPKHWTTLKKLLFLRFILAGSGEKIVWTTVSGTSPLALVNALAHEIRSITQYGKCVQPAGTMNTAITQYGKCEQRNLPHGYTELDYIQSDGSQYIDLNTTLDQDDVIEIEFEIIGAQNSTNIFGYRAGASSNNIMLFFGSTSNRVFIDFNNSNYADYRLSYDVSLNTRYKAIISKARRAILTADGTTLAENTTACPDTISCPSAYLFAASGTPAYNYGSPCKVYSCRINGKRSLVGAKDASDVVEMYDKVSTAPFVNAGTGTFTAGPDATPSPTAPMDIVCNNGVLRYSRNLLDPSTSNIIIGEFVQESGSTATALNNWRTGYIPIVGGKTYAFWGRAKADNTISAYNRINWYTANKVNISPRPSYTQNTVTVGTAPSNAAYAMLACAPRNSQTAITRETFDEFNWMFAEASKEIPYTPYGVGGIYADGTPEVLTVSGKNIYNVAGDTSDHYIGADGQIGLDSASCYSAFIPVSAGQYTYSGLCGTGTSSTANNKRIHGYLNGVWVQQIDVITVNRNDPFSFTFSVPSGIDAIRISHWRNDTQTMVEAGSEATDYEPYRAQTVNDVPMLLGVGDYKDTAELISGIKTGKVGVLVLDGVTTGKKFNEVWNATYKRCNLGISGMASTSASVEDALCTRFGYSVTVNSSPTKDAFCTNNGTLLVSFVEDADVTSPADANAKLAAWYAEGNPAILLYTLAASTTEQTTAYPQLCNKLYTVADVTAEVDDISVTFTTGTQTVPNPYSQLPIVCNNGVLKWNGTAVVADGTPEVLTVFQNLYDERTMLTTNPMAIIGGTLYWRYAEESTAAAILVPCKPNTEYTLKYSGGNRCFIGGFINEVDLNPSERITCDFNIFTNSSAAVSPKTFTTPANCNYLAIGLKNTAGTAVSDIAVFETPQTVNDVPMLLGVGDYKDEAELVAGAVTHSVGIKVLDGTEDWFWNFPLQNMFNLRSVVEPTTDRSVLCTHFRTQSTVPSNRNGYCVKSAEGNIGIGYSSLNGDVDAFKAWLASEYAKGTPVIVLYPLAASTTEQTTAHALNSYNGTTIVDAQTNVDPVTLEVEYAASA